jgi:hypothetical protein
MKQCKEKKEKYIERPGCPGFKALDDKWKQSLNK